MRRLEGFYNPTATAYMNRARNEPMDRNEQIQEAREEEEK
jgi:hypothetical protein